MSENTRADCKVLIENCELKRVFKNSELVPC